MATPLETQILGAVLPGAASGPNWFNGSGSCEALRVAAAERLRSEIDRAIEAGATIAPLDDACEQRVLDIARRGDRSVYELTQTWRALSDCIRACEHAAHGSHWAFEDFLSAYPAPKRQMDMHGCWI
jgi:hypothetical protein